jgi:hypothetical protein
MSRPTCYIESPLGSESLSVEAHEALLADIRPHVEPINPFFIEDGACMPEVFELSQEERQERWCSAALDLYRVMRHRADMGLALQNDDPTDGGVGHELSFGYALHILGVRRFPIVTYAPAEDSMTEPRMSASVRTEGLSVTRFEAIQHAVAQIAVSVSTARNSTSLTLIK